VQAGFVWVVVFAVLMAVVGAFYYLRVIKLMYFDEPTDHSPITAPLDMRIALGVNAIGLLVIGLMPQSFMEICAYAMVKSLS
jgi:NADH-quinone oxidoreductase subunit N